MSDRTDCPAVADANADLAKKAEAVLAEQGRALQRTLAALAVTQAALEMLQSQRRVSPSYLIV